jgi:type I restriction enzyme S subunit
VTLNLDRSDWKRFSLGEIARASKEKVDPADGSVTRFVAGEHMDTNDLKVHRWGDVGEVDLGPAFHRRFRPGQVLYGSRRTYLRKVAVADFDGVCANTTFVVETMDEGVLLQQFLPFIMCSEPFHAFAIAESKGSVNPYVNWSDIERYEFDLPSLDEQKRLADLLWAIERHRRALDSRLRQLSEADVAWTRDALSALVWNQELADVIRKDRPLCYGVVQPGVDVEDGVGLIRVLDLEGGSPDRASLKRVTVDIDAQYRRSRVEPGDVLLSIVGTIGRSWIVTDEFEGCNIARALARISTDRTTMLPSFLQWVLSATDVQQTLLSAAFESARKTLNLSVLAKLQMPQLTVGEQVQLLSQRKWFTDASDSTRAEANTAQALRDSLLAEIFGGA